MQNTAQNTEGQEQANDKDAGKATLQGWAMVENMTEADWENISLSLVSGQPISYTMDLYTPLYVNRPEVQIPALRLAAAAHV